MTLGELKKIIDETCDFCDPDSVNVEIPYKDFRPMFGASSAVSVAGAGLGFDWDDGRFFIFPRHTMFCDYIDSEDKQKTSCLNCSLNNRPIVGMAKPCDFTSYGDNFFCKYFTPKRLKGQEEHNA